MTDLDLVVEVMATGLDAETITVGDIMAPELVTIHASKDTSAAVRGMWNKCVRRLPVVNDEGRLLDLVSFDDVLEVAADELLELARTPGLECNLSKNDGLCMTARWEHFEHGADIGVRGVGTTKAEAFEQAAVALTAVITDLDTVQPQETISIECEAPDDELLLAEWLNALIYEMATRKMLFRRFRVELQDGKLLARADGEHVDVARHQPAVEAKGATYTALRVARDGDEWIAQTVVDV